MLSEMFGWKLKFETELSHSGKDLVDRRSHASGARLRTLFVGALLLHAAILQHAERCMVFQGPVNYVVMLGLQKTEEKTAIYCNTSIRRLCLSNIQLLSFSASFLSFYLRQRRVGVRFFRINQKYRIFMSRIGCKYSKSPKDS